MEYVIKTIGLTKKFGDKTVVDHVNMHVKKGDIYGFIGKNGAGKTTTMKIILGLLFQNKGSVELFGSTNLNAMRSKIGSLVETPGIYKDCTAYENMKRLAILSGSKDDEINNLLNFVGLGNTAQKKAGQFSLGMKQRLGIAMALLGNPELLILDEPINGLDPAGIKEIRDILLKVNHEKGTTFLISSHLLDELAKVVNTYGIIHNGALIEEISRVDLEERCKHSLDIEVDDAKLASKVLEKNFSIKKPKISDHTISIEDHINDSASINKALNDAGILVSKLVVRNVSFEDYFIERIGK